MFLKNSLDFFKLVKKIFCIQKNNNSLDIFSNSISLTKENLLSLFKEENKDFFLNLDVLICILASSIIGLRTIFLGGEVKISKEGIFVKRYNESFVEICPEATSYLENSYLRPCSEVIEIVNSIIFGNKYKICSLNFFVNSFIGLDEYWIPAQNLFAFAKYWNSKTKKWSRLPLGRVKRMSIHEVGDILQGLVYKVFELDRNIINVIFNYKEIIFTFKNKNGELNVKKIFSEIKKKWKKKEINNFNKFKEKVFFLLIEEAKILDLLDSSLPRSILLKWLIKIRNFFLGHFSVKKNFQVLFSKEE